MVPVPRARLDEKYWAIYEAAKRGLTNKEIAQECGVRLPTLTAWLRNNEELRDMVENLRGLPAKLVEMSVLKAAVGYDYEERVATYEMVDGELTLVKENISVKHVKPDIAAAKYLLNNRGENWTDKVQVDTSQEITISFDPALKDV